MSDHPPDSAEEGWRIDELAHRAHTSVDTIRFYHRDGLLPPARRSGRSGVYGPDHLRRLEQIRDLQARHFNLAAVKALLAQNQLGAIQPMFLPDRGTLSRDELIAQCGLTEAMVSLIEGNGLLVQPAETGQTGYDHGDLDALVAVRELLDLGVPESVALFFTRLYADSFAEICQRTASLLDGGPEIDWPEAERTAFVARLGEEAGAVFELTGRLIGYAHRATARRLAVQFTVDAGDAASSDPASGDAASNNAGDAAPGDHPSAVRSGNAD